MSAVIQWPSGLIRLLETTYAALSEEHVEWAVIGSAASALQHCQVTPNDIDLLMRAPAGVYRFAELMTPYTPPTCAYQRGDSQWGSSQALPVSAGPDAYGFMWHFGRWYIDGFKVEAAHIEPLPGQPSSQNGAGIWEAGPEIWPYVRNVLFAGYQVPVVPLEIQIGTNLQRGLSERVAAIIRLFRQNGYQHELIQKSLAAELLPVFEKLM